MLIFPQRIEWSVVEREKRGSNSHEREPCVCVGREGIGGLDKHFPSLPHNSRESCCQICLSTAMIGHSCLLGSSATALLHTSQRTTTWQLPAKRPRTLQFHFFYFGGYWWRFELEGGCAWHSGVRLSFEMLAFHVKVPALSPSSSVSDSASCSHILGGSR